MGRASPFISLEEDERRRVAGGPPVPFFILTGFLGAGKTTLLNRLLAAPGGRRVAILVNDVGRINIDRQLIAAEEGDILELTGGCVCCKVDLQRDLWTGVDDLVERARPDVVLLETTGIADPALLLASFEEVTTRRSRAIPSGVICVIDAELGAVAEKRPEWRAQVDVADAFVLAKLDRAAPASVAALHARLAELRPEVERVAFPPGDEGTRAIAPFLLTPRTTCRRPAPATHAHGQLSVYAFVEPARFLEAPLTALFASLGEELLRAKGFVRLDDGAWAWVERAGAQTIVERREPPSPRTQGELVMILDAGASDDEESLRRRLWACHAAG
jgi:G3E family GTPase